MSAINNTFLPCDPHRVELYNLWSGGTLSDEFQSSSLIKCQYEAVEHARKFFCFGPDALHRLRITNTEPDHYRLDVEENTGEGRYVATIARILPPWMTYA